MGRDIRIANRKAKISLVTPVLPQVIRWISTYKFPCNFVFWCSITTLRFWIKLTNIKGPTIKIYRVFKSSKFHWPKDYWKIKKLGSSIQ
jgi:hypothetical protein